MKDTFLQSEIQSRNAAPPVPPPVRHPLRPFVLGALLILFLGAGWGTYRAISFEKAEKEAAAERELARATARAQFTDALAKLPNMADRTVADGFWYAYTDADGNEHIFSFDLERESLRGLSDTERARMMEMIAGARIIETTDMRQLRNEELPANLQFHNELYSFGTAGSTSLELKNALEAKVRGKNATSADLTRLAYIYELEGNYARRDALHAENCARFTLTCADATDVALDGRVVDGRGIPVPGARVEVISRPDIPPVTTDANGRYKVKTGAMEMEKFRVKASKRNFSDGYGTALVLSKGKLLYHVEDIAIESPMQVVTVDFVKKTVSGAGNSLDAAGNLVLTTPRSRYEIPEGAIVDANGKPYAAGPIDIYLYEFTKGDPPESLTNSDTFDEVVGYAGDLMKTFGMPYIQFFTAEGVPLDVRSSKPMRLTYTIADMEALRTNQDGIYRPLTKADMEVLVAASVGQPSRIDREFLINNRMLHFPAFWVFDRRRGVWDNVGIAVLDVEGTIQSPFYTVRD